MPEYTDIPRDEHGRPLFTHIRSYTDTADTGADYLCSIIYGEYNHEAYVLDIYYTKDPMEVTEPETARRLLAHSVNLAKIESNNGGRGFARNVCTASSIWSVISKSMPPSGMVGICRFRISVVSLKLTNVTVSPNRSSTVRGESFRI